VLEDFTSRGVVVLAEVVFTTVELDLPAGNHRELELVELGLVDQLGCGHAERELVDLLGLHGEGLFNFTRDAPPFLSSERDSRITGSDEAVVGLKDLDRLKFKIFAASGGLSLSKDLGVFIRLFLDKLDAGVVLTGEFDWHSPPLGDHFRAFEEVTIGMARSRADDGVELVVLVVVGAGERRLLFADERIPSQYLIEVALQVRGHFSLQVGGGVHLPLG